MPRPVLQTCGKLRVEVRPLILQAFKWPDYDKAKPLQISRRVRNPRSTLITGPVLFLAAAIEAALGNGIPCCISAWQFTEALEHSSQDAESH